MCLLGFLFRNNRGKAASSVLDGFPLLQTPYVQAKLESKRTGIFHIHKKREFDKGMMGYEHLSNFSCKESIISALPLCVHMQVHTHTYTHCFYESQLINANSFRHISTKLLFHLIAGEFSITKFSLADFFALFIYFSSFTNSEVGMWYYLLFVRLKFHFHLKCFLILAAPHNLGETELKEDRILFFL